MKKVVCIVCGRLRNPNYRSTTGSGLCRKCADDKIWTPKRFRELSKLALRIHPLIDAINHMSKGFISRIEFKEFKELLLSLETDLGDAIEQLTIEVLSRDKEIIKK